MLLNRILLVAITLSVPSAGFAQAQADNGATDASATMACIRGGRVQMGIDLEEIPRYQTIFGIKSTELFKDEAPKHWVSVHDFYIDKYLVTNAQFKKFTDANLEWQPDHLPGELDNGNYLKHWKKPGEFIAKADHPVVNVNWYAAAAYCRSEGKRLPTEAEWEFAARGGADGLFPWGNQMVDFGRANYGGIEGSTSPVRKYPANPYGLFDMAGNVWEFVADEWARYPSAEQSDPIGGGNRFLAGSSYLQVRSRRVIRGGSFEGAPVNLWVEYRDSHPPNGSREFVGFRCAKWNSDLHTSAAKPD